MEIKNYLPIAVENEGVFRAVLRDLKGNSHQRPGGLFVPKDLEAEKPLQEIFQKYSTGQRRGIFTITEFSVSEDGLARITFANEAPLSGGGARLRYKIVSRDEVSYQGSDWSFRS